jgi:GT2 family glycosyltransferase
MSCFNEGVPSSEDKHNPSLTVLIVNYESKISLEKCVKSFNKYLSLDNIKIIIVDNNSSDNVFDGIFDSVANVDIIILNDNLGFAKANNYVASRITSKYILFLNPDTILFENCILPIIDFMEMHPEAGACGPVLLNKDLSYQTSTGFKMGLLFEIAEAFFFMHLLRIIQKQIYFRKRNILQPIKVSWLSGAFMLIRKNVFEDVGGFDEDYFLNYEDIDLCKKLEEKGYFNYYFPNLKCVHTGLSSQSKDFQRLVINRYQSRLLYARKHYNFLARLFIRIIHIIGLILRLCLIFFSNRSIENIQRMEGYRKSFEMYFKFQTN